MTRSTGNNSIRDVTDGSTMTGNEQWYESDDVAIKVEDTEVGREVSLYELVDGEWARQYTLPAGQAREYQELFRQVFPDGEE